MFLQKRSITDVLKPILHRVKWQAIAFAVIYPIVVILLCALLAQILNWAVVDWKSIPTAVKLPPLNEFIWAVSLIIGEEYAWRGYFFHGFSKVYGPIYGALIVGVV